jgi:hypothetical protein
MRRVLASFAALALSCTGLVLGLPRVAAAFPSDHLDIAGHGFGHGRGMGQYGALGYALKGTGYADILQHYYSNTTAANLSGVAGGGDPMTVELTRLAPTAAQPAGFDTIVAQENGKLTVNGAPIVSKAARAVRVGVNSFRIDTAADCGGGPTGWTPGANAVSGPVVFGSSGDSPANNDRTQMLQLCQPDGAVRWLRGEILAEEGEGAAHTVNRLPMESYLRGVVPRESPASWGTLGGGAGINAQGAPAGAARSYSFSVYRHPTWDPPV